jgi:hypothetical protein
VPPITTGILFVTVFVVDADAAAEESIVPVAEGKVKTVEPAADGACRVTVPLTSPAITTELIETP